jgi:hypothetical protein
MIKFPTKQEITKSSVERHCGMCEAEKDLTKKALQNALSNANSLDEVKEILSFVISNSEFDIRKLDKSGNITQLWDKL